MIFSGIISCISKRHGVLSSINNISKKRVVLRFRHAPSLVENYKNRKYNEDENSDEPIDEVGYFLLSVPIVSFILGSWQIQRRSWKLNLISELKEKTTSLPRPMPDNFDDLQNMEYCPVKVRGEFLYDREFAIGPKSFINDEAETSGGSGLISFKKTTGYNLITPFKVENNDITILVNRGWIAAKPEKLSKKQLGHTASKIVEICGVVRLHEERQSLMPKNSPKSGVWIYRDLNTMSRMAGTDPVFLDLMSSSATSDGPIAGQTRITLRNEHMSYIITWYSLTIITAWMWHRLYIRKLPLL